MSAIVVFVAALTPTVASACEAEAQAVAQAENAQLLAVTIDGDKCIVKLLVKRPNQPPQRKTVVLDRK